jgi:hypothetical protein
MLIGPTPWLISTTESSRTICPVLVRTCRRPMSSGVSACDGWILIRTS